MKTFLKTFVADESGASAAEYALILAIVGVAVGAAALGLGANVKGAIADAAKDVYKCNNATMPAAAEAPDSSATKVLRKVFMVNPCIRLRLARSPAAQVYRHGSGIYFRLTSPRGAVWNGATIFSL